MKTFGIIAAVVTVVGILGWIVVQTLKTDNSESAYNMHPSNFEKPNLEKTIDFEGSISPEITFLDEDEEDEAEKNDPTT